MSATFFNNEFSMECFRYSGVKFLDIFVPSRTPGATQFTSISGARDIAIHLVRWFKPAFETAYAIDDPQAKPETEFPRPRVADQDSTAASQLG